MSKSSFDWDKFDLQTKQRMAKLSPELAELLKDEEPLVIPEEVLLKDSAELLALAETELARLNTNETLHDKLVHYQHTFLTALGQFGPGDEVTARALKDWKNFLVTFERNYQ